MTPALTRRVTTRRGTGLAVALLPPLLAACAPRPASNAGADSAATGPASAVPLPAVPRAPVAGAIPKAAGDTGAIARLEREARALAHVEGCAAAGRCRTAPLGHRACGGPRDYVVYCATTTDSAALFRRLDELSRAEEAEQQRSGVVSTCEFRMPPTAVLAGGRCGAASGVP